MKKEKRHSATQRLLSVAKAGEIRDTYFKMLLMINPKKLSKEQRNIALLLAIYLADLQ